MFKTYKGIFNERAHAYHRAMQECPVAREEEFLNLIELADLSDGDRVCDIPAGGCYLERFLNKKIKLISVETSIEFIQCSDKSQSQKKILCEDLGSIPLKSGSIDKVVSLAGLHHLKNKHSFYKSAFRLLKKRGVLSLADVRRGSDAGRFLNIFVHENSSMGHVGDFIDLKTKGELEHTGFRVDYAQPVHFSWKFDSEEKLGRFYQRLFGIDLARQEKILDGIRNYLGYCKEDGLFCVNWELLYFKAVKP